MAGNYLKKSRHGTKYHFRRRIPDDLRRVFGQSYLTHSLCTDSRACAVKLARAAVVDTDNIFEQVRHMASEKDPSNAERISNLIVQWKHKHALQIQKDEHEAEIEALLQQHRQEMAGLRSKAKEVALKAHILGRVNTSESIAPTVIKLSGQTITQVWNGYKAEKIALGKQDGVKGGWKDGEDTALRDYWPHVREFMDVVGDKDIASVTADDVERFVQHVLAAVDGGRARNRQKRLQRAGAIFRWAKKKRYISDSFEELFRYDGKIEENHYFKFESGDLTALFESSEYREHRFKTPSDYWLPLLALFSGARLNELCQLVKSDIGTHDGVSTISILDEDFKRLKTSASRRIVPIHSKLIELGFLDYVSSIKQGRIFPELPEDPGRPGNYGPKASELFTAYRRKCEVGELNGRSRKVFHSFRSTLISALRKANVPKDRRTRLAGHEYDDTQDKHYTGGDALTMFDFNTLKRDIELVVFNVAFTPYRVTG